MSGIGQFNNNKQTSWGRSNNSPNLVNPGSSIQSQLISQGSLGNINSPGMVPFQHQQVFQNAMTLQQQNIGLGLQQMANNMGISAQMTPNTIFQQVSAVSYPNPRALNPTAFQTQAMPSISQVQNNSGQGTKQRVFTGTVTKVDNNFGFVDDDVFFQTNVCVQGQNPMVGDRVLVEASYNPNRPFKWNATRIRVLQNTANPTSPNTSRHSNSGKNFSNSSSYNAVPPPSDSDNGNNFPRNPRQRSSLGRRERSRERERDEEEIERKRRREDRIREREKEEKKSPVHRRSRSPKVRRRTRVVPRYMIQIPKIMLSLPEADVLEIRKRYNNLYIPSDFFYTRISWVDAFPPDVPFAIDKPCSFHIMSKEIDGPVVNDSILEPPDADYKFSAKVMLMGVPNIEELYQKCCAMAEDRDKESEDRDFVHPTRLINFLVGLRGKNETMAIGGPWSPSLDGENVEKDPSVLIKTAIRTCKALTGIDLSNCTKWYRFVELCYRRAESTHKGRQVPARVETVVLFLPDVWSCLPTRIEWDEKGQLYKKKLESLLVASQDCDDGSTAVADEKDEDLTSICTKLEPSHYSLLDVKMMQVTALREELLARNLNAKGLKSQLVARLTKALKAEAEKDSDEHKEEKEQEEMELDADNKEEKKSDPEIKILDEKEKAILQKRYILPEQPHIIVHPSKVAKSGKFDCTTMSLSLLLDYRPEDTKEHSFEVSLFAELFNEMLMRDFGFNIFKALSVIPDKSKDDKKEKEEKSERKKDEEKKKKDDKDKKKYREKKNDEEKNSDTEKDRKGIDNNKIDEDRKKKDDKKSDSGDSDEEIDSDRKDKKDKKEKKHDRVKLYTKNKHLLLSFIYFDQSHCGYIFDKDIEELLYTLGLHLSRAQVKKLVNKVVTRDSLHYRKLTDKTKDEDIDLVEKDEVNAHNLAMGNKIYLPIFKDQDSSKMPVTNIEDKSDSEGLVSYRGAIVDIGKLLSQLERSEKARLETESRMIVLKNENTKLTEKCNKSSSTIKNLHSEVKEFKDKLRTTEDTLTRVTAHSKLYQITLLDIRDKIEPVLKTGHKDKEECKKVKEERKEVKKEDSKVKQENDESSARKSKNDTDNIDSLSANSLDEMIMNIEKESTFH